MSFTVIRTWKKGQVRGEFMRSVSVSILMISCIEQKAFLEWLKQLGLCVRHKTRGVQGYAR